MIALDVPTAMFAMGLVLVVLGLMFQGGWKGGEIYAPSRQWAPAAVLYGLGLMLVSTRAEWSPLLSVVLANSFIMGGVCLLHRGVAVHVGAKPADRWYLASLLVLVASFLWFTMGRADVQARIAIQSALVTPFVAHSFVLLRHAPPSFGHQLFQRVLLVSTVWFGIRAIVATFSSAVRENYLAAGGGTAINFFFSALAAVIMVAAQYRLEAERVRAALASEAEILRLDRDLLEETVENRTAELSRSNADLEQFAYVASHDLREPLRMISAYIKLIGRRLGDGADAELKEFLEIARNGAKRLDEMVLHLLEFSRIGHSGVPRSNVPMKDVLLAVLGDLQLAIQECGAIVELDENLPTISGSREELTRLVQNLLSNALKFRDPERPLVIRVSASRPERQNGGEDEGRWLLSFSDTGIGIEPEYFERIFQIFQRLHARDKYDGTGIGLAICRKIIERHGGCMWVESTSGQGTTFKVALPA